MSDLGMFRKSIGVAMKEARGLYRMRRIGGLGSDVRVTDGATEMDMPESIYREWGCRPDCDELPWKIEYDANSKPKAAVPKRPKRQKRPAK